MGKLLVWRDDRDCQCCCDYCSADVDCSGYYVGEDCPICKHLVQLVEDEKFSGWVSCPDCHFSALGVVEELEGELENL